MLTRRQFLSGVTGAAVGGACGAQAGAGAASQACRAGSTEIVTLRGDARAVGRRLGELNGEDIRQHMRKVLDGWRKRGLSDKNMIERSGPFCRFAARFSPAWADEHAACAETAGVRLELYEAYLAGKYRSLFFVDECTSFLAVGGATADGATLFHKNRDNVARAQCAYQKKISHASNPAGFYSIGDTSDTGLMMMVNEHGLAGSADTGGLREDRPKGKGVMNPYILRVVAERAERCQDALEIIQQMIKDGWYAGGSQTGTHWLFADRFGKGLRVAQNSHEEKHWFFEDDVAFLTRGNTTAGKAFSQKKGRITVRDVNAAAGHPDLCFTSSISALTVRIDPKRPAELSSVWVALPAYAPYIPLFPAAVGVPKEVFDGTCFRAGCGLLELRAGDKKTTNVVFPDLVAQNRQAVQERLYVDADNAEQEVRAAYQRGRMKEAARIGTDGTLAACARLMSFLGQTRKS